MYKTSLSIPIFKSKFLEGSTIVLHDINPKTLIKTAEIANNYKKKLRANYSIVATTNRKEALKDADFIQECAPEYYSVKTELMSLISKYSKNNAIIASSSSCTIVIIGGII